MRRGGYITKILYIQAFKCLFFDKVFPDVRYFFTIVPISYVHIGSRSNAGKCFISSSIISSPSLSKCFSNYVDYSHTTTTYMAAKKIQQTQYFFLFAFYLFCMFCVCKSSKLYACLTFISNGNMYGIVERERPLKAPQATQG